MNYNKKAILFLKIIVRVLKNICVDNFSSAIKKTFVWQKKKMYNKCI